jgi:S-disulfanyl-L-cysteine oxidoreductase SoxD
VAGKEGGVGPVLVSQSGPYKVGTPRTIGSYWPYATTLYNYIYRVMPFNRPESLQSDELYAVIAYLLNQNKIIGDNDEMNATTLPQVKMPNRDRFKSCWPTECRPDVP